MKSDALNRKRARAYNFFVGRLEALVVGRNA
jgi:hypothetical protein